ncbi:Retrovirus-related Pol polyprotein from transposon [Nosema granulosis]|uniref:RNA-directed DNA polymerase n=1 Tax=Nosema granulosis TaxID=83296 RepID=A0A9P6GXA0_9MICR|nr:Retrovirus-related Pol polyprotein from transposon [Nosema granulosis]
MCSNYRNNPFFTKIIIEGKQRNCLIDTGADVSIIHKNMLPKQANAEEFYGIIKTADGTRMRIKSRTRGLSGIIFDTKIMFDPLITEQEPDYIILGVDILKKYPNVLLQVLDRNWPKVHNIQKCDQEMERIKTDFRDLFKDTIEKHKPCTVRRHYINTGNSLPIYCRPGRVPINFEKSVEEEVRKNLEMGIISESESPWNSRIVPVTKKDGSLRMCIDFRPLNKITIKDRYPIPRIDEILDLLSGATIFTTLDATSGYYQLLMADEDKEKTAFSWKGGHYEFNRMPFGLCNAPATFQRAMDYVLREERGMFVIPYLDDIIIYSKDLETHVIHVRQVLHKLREAGIILNIKKCKFAMREVKILGNVVAEGIIKPDPEKVECIKSYPLPRTIKELRAFLGLVNYCREFITAYTRRAKPLFDLLKGETKRSVKTIIHSEETISAFKELRDIITENTERAQPDFNKEFVLTTDASDTGIGAILAQIDDQGRERMISAYSKNFDKHQNNYSVTDKELLAVVKSIEHYRHYLLGKEFLLRTDHKALTYLWESKNPSSRLLRWSMKLQEYKFRLEYIKGENNAADGYSRICHIKKSVQSFSETEKFNIIEEYHRALGHGSPNNMKASILQRYKWDGIYKDIENYVANCQICKRFGGPIVNTKNKCIQTKHPNELWEIDLAGKIDDKGNGFFIIVCIDHYTKWIETKTILRKTASEIVKAIKELILDKHGVPERILTDSGLEFNNQFTRDLSREHGFKWEFSSPFHHQTTGAVERVIQTLCNKIKKLSEYGSKNIRRCVEEATLAVNLSFNRAIGTSPFIFRKGRLPELPIDIQLGQPRINVSRKKIMNKRKTVFLKYKHQIEKGKVQTKNAYKEGDKVLIFRSTQNKMKPNWHQGYVIKEKLSDDSYIVVKNHKEIRVNKKHLRRE